VKASGTADWASMKLYNPRPWHEGIADTDALEISLVWQPFTSKQLREAEETRVHRQEVEAEKWRIKIREDARAELRAERDAYLTSEQGRAEAAQRFESFIIDLDDIPDPDPVIEGFLHRDTLVRTFGPPKSLKSFVTLDMAACVSLGIEWQGRPTVQQTVLYVVAEGVRGVKKRRAAWNRHHGTEMKVIFFPKPVQIGNQEEMFDLIAFCLAKQVGYVIFDTQARCTVGVEENDNTEMGEIVSALDILKQETGACVHLVHHSGTADAKRARGASAFDGAVDAEFFTERDSKSPEFVTFRTKFQKDIAESDDVELVTIEVAGSLVLDEAGGSSEVHGEPDDVPVALPAVTDKQMPYLKAISFYREHGAGQTELSKKMIEDADGNKITYPALVRSTMIALEDKGLVEIINGKWKITPTGGAVIMRELSERENTERAWVDRKPRRRPAKPSQAEVFPEVSERPENLGSETFGTFLEP
jgi:hypothetical protein